VRGSHSAERDSGNYRGFHAPIDDLEVQERVLRRETATGSDHGERIEEVLRQKAMASETLAQLKTKWDKTKLLVEEIRGLRGELENRRRAGRKAGMHFARSWRN